jgi:hypothetical protein
MGVVNNDEVRAASEASSPEPLGDPRAAQEKNDSE